MMNAPGVLADDPEVLGKIAARQTGSMLSDPFATLSFLALPVIPALKLTDRGLFAL